jgi:hypothetical protein
MALRGGGAGAEGENGVGFGVIDVEDGEEPGELQDVVELFAEIRQMHFGALTARADVQRYEHAQAGTVDVVDARHIQDDFLSVFDEEGFDPLAKSGALWAENDPAIEGDDGNSIYFFAGDVIGHKSSQAYSSNLSARSQRAFWYRASFIAVINHEMVANGKNTAGSWGNPSEAAPWLPAILSMMSPL